MAGDSCPEDVLFAALIERLTRSAGVAEACSIVLDSAALRLQLGRAILVIETDAGPRCALWGMPDSRLGAILQEFGEPESPVMAFIRHSKCPTPSVSAAGSFPPLDFRSFVSFSFGGVDDSAVGAAFVEADAVDASCHAFAQLLQRCGPLVARLAEIESLRAKNDRAERQRNLLTTIIDAMPDPVLISDSANNIVLTNHRADLLLGAQPDDSDGRRRAIQINNLLFSSLLTRSAFHSGPVSARELNLVDTRDGSDLLFEVLSLPVEISGRQPGTISVLREITDLRQALNELEVEFRRSRVAEHDARRERDRLNIILENVSDPILVTDDQTKIVLMNREADRLFVLDRSTDGRQRHQIQSNDTHFTTLISTFLLHPEQRQVERMSICDPETGHEFPAEVVSSKIMNSRGEPIAVVSVVHDLTDVKENERLACELGQLNDQLEERIRRATVELEKRNKQLEWQSFELQKASRLKSEFLASMSHELRTPINVLLGYTSLIRDQIYGTLTDQQTEALDKTYSTTQHLLELINDILDLSKIEAGKMPLHVEPISIGEVIAEVAESVEPMMRMQRLSFRTDVDGDIPPIPTDRTKVKQILLNLVSNAIKFTEEGSVSVTARRLLDEGGVEMIVADTGIGVPPEHIDTIFEDFQQLDQSNTRPYGGTGLGLSITKKLLTLLGGTIAVESVPGAGTRFTIHLPATSRERIDAGRRSASVIGE